MNNKEVEKKYCCECGNELEESEAIYFEGEYYCQSCLDDITVICDNCGDRVRENDAECDDNMSVCSTCYETHYTRCERCNCLVYREDAYYFEDDEDDDYPYCQSCYESEQANHFIHLYNYKPQPIFYGTLPRYFGVELEIDEAGKYNDNAKSILDVANTEDVENIYIKADGSLNDGLEIVSHPMTFDYHKNTMPWRKIVKCAVDMGYRSHKTSTCGLHCHVNRNSLGYNTTEQENTIARILYFIEHHWAEILKFSRRTSYQMERWANRYGRKNNPKEFISNVKSKSSSNRYVAVNLQNNDTIEFRMFKGTLKYNTIIATLEFVNAVCDAAVNMTDEEMADLSWNDFVSALNEYTYKELITYLKERNLYINEPVEYEEEE